MITLPLAEQRVYWTIQGEGIMTGLPTVFVRLAGCSVGCQHCDTDYAVREWVDVAEIVTRCVSCRGNAEWAWITGGEPTDHDITPLVVGLQDADFRVALATAGTRPVQRGQRYSGVDFLSVSPHDPSRLVQCSGDQINIVPGLNGFSLADFEQLAQECEDGFSHRYVTPCDGMPETFEECLEWVKRHQGWRLGLQGHKLWNLP